ncbi:HAD family hydrolase [Streptomyces canus]|uniref:HAD family hydrolase n=1 Tax=Streptomyces canus TaxID=58343 RepID=UPI003805B2E6
MKKYILFDHDGVLVDTEFWYFRSAERALMEAGFTLDKDQYLRDTARGSGSWAQAKTAGMDDRTLSRVREARNGYYQEYLRTEAIEIDGVVDTHLVREDYELAKPHSEPYLAGLKRFGADREETLVVEDSARGLTSAVAAGIDCAVVHSEFTEANDFPQASHRIDSLSGLKDILLEVS